MEEELRSIAYEFLKLVGGDLDKYTRTKNEVKETPEGAILFTPSHVQFAAYGRGPGKRPPLDNIFRFRKKIIIYYLKVLMKEEPHLQYKLVSQRRVLKIMFRMRLMF